MTIRKTSYSFLLCITVSISGCASNDHEHFSTLDNRTMYQAKARADHYARKSHTLFTNDTRTDGRISKMGNFSFKPQVNARAHTKFNSLADEKISHSFNTQRSSSIPRRSNRHTANTAPVVTASFHRDSANFQPEPSNVQQALHAPQTVAAIDNGYQINLAPAMTHYALADNNSLQLGRTSRVSTTTTKTSSNGKIKKNAKQPKRSVRDDIEEYVRRIGKRILIVIDKSTENYEFSVSNSMTPSLQLYKPGKIQISLGLLSKLTDEAELAAILSQKIAMLRNMQIYFDAPISANQAMDIDKYSMIYMTRAGYDPQAAIELQELYLNKTGRRYGSWLNDLYGNNPPTPSQLAANKGVASKLPNGLQRGKERYSKNIGRI